jgi:hypothetical protein
MYLSLRKNTPSAEYSLTALSSVFSKQLSGAFTPTLEKNISKFIVVPPILPRFNFV